MDENQLPRTWTPKDDIAKISKHARLASAEVLAQLTIFQGQASIPEALKIEESIREMAKRDFESTSTEPRSASAKNGTLDIHVAVEWPDIPAEHVLIQPAAVRTAWKHFMTETKLQITQVILGFEDKAQMLCDRQR